MKDGKGSGGCLSACRVKEGEWDMWGGKNCSEIAVR